MVFRAISLDPLRRFDVALEREFQEGPQRARIVIIAGLNDC
jgi:hypothetical protein